MQIEDMCAYIHENIVKHLLNDDGLYYYIPLNIRDDHLIKPISRKLYIFERVKFICPRQKLVASQWLSNIVCENSQVHR